MKTNTQHTTTQDTFLESGLVFVTLFVTSSPWKLELPTRREPRGGGSDDSDSGFGTNAWASQWPWPSHSTIQPQGDRRRPGSGEGGASRTTRPRSGRPLFPQRELFELSFDEEPGGMRPDRLAGVRPQEKVQQTPWSRSSTPRVRCRLLTFLCR